MFRLKEPLPALSKPDVFSPEIFQSALMQYQTWHREDVVQKCGEEIYQALMQLTGTLHQFNQFTIERRMLILMGQPAREKLLDVLHRLEDMLGTDYLPVKELRAHLLSICAEAADLLYRQEDKPNAIVTERLGLQSLDEVETAYQVSCAIYGKCCVTYILSHLEPKPNDTTPYFGILYDQWLGNYLSALSRYLLMKMAKRLKEIDPAIIIRLSSSDEVLPHIITHPEIRDAFDEETEQFILYGAIRFFLSNTANQNRSCYAIFTNLALIAIILNDLNYARYSLKLARGFSQDIHSPQITRLEQLINTLEPRVQA